eukprot:1152467-Pelagomonas_calceolata.AAC.6
MACSLLGCVVHCAIDLSNWNLAVPAPSPEASKLELTCVLDSRQALHAAACTLFAPLAFHWALYSCPYELRICNKCDWHTVQDEEHVILDCPSQDLTELRTQFQHLFSSALPSSASRLRDSMNQDDVLGLTKFVSACLKCCD